MKDTMEVLEMAVFNALNGQLSYNSVNVPVYDEKMRLTANEKLFVILSTQQESDGPQTSDTFITDSSIDIEILQKTESEVSKRPIHDVSNQIMQLLIPTPDSNGLGVQDHWQIVNVRRERAITRNWQVTDTQSIMGKVITITCQIVQQSP